MSLHQSSTAIVSIPSLLVLVACSGLQSATGDMEDIAESVPVVEKTVDVRPVVMFKTNEFLTIATRIGLEDIEVTDELICLAKNIYFEARGQSDKGQLAVAFVTMNRVKNKYFPNTVCGVVHQYKQFSWLTDGRGDDPKNWESWEKAMQIGAAVLNSYTFAIVPFSTPDITNGSTHYHADYVSPGWALSMNKHAQIGSHIFYN